MLKQAEDFYEESNDIHYILKNISEDKLNTRTQFKSWSFTDIIRHLHVWNIAAYKSLQGEKEWVKFNSELQLFFKNGQKLSDFERNFTDNINGKELIDKWQNTFKEVSKMFRKEDSKKRVKWVGPDMSVISSISARHMETWAHSQAIYDSLGKIRENKDRILNIVIIGNNTFNWSYKVNKKKTPSVIPFLKLESPSGKQWRFNNPASSDVIEGKAEEFCQVVTQVRNIEDVSLKTKGNIAKEWMSIAQCFAGNASQPPKPGTRRVCNR